MKYLTILIAIMSVEVSSININRPRITLEEKYLDIERHINTNDGMIFSNNTCKDCDEVKKMLKDAGVHTLNMNVDLQADGKAYKENLPMFCGQKEFPMVFVAGEFVGDKEDLKKLLAKEKDIKAYIKKTLDIPPPSNPQPAAETGKTSIYTSKPKK